MDDLYRENILQHYKRPHNWGELPDADLEAEACEIAQPWPEKRTSEIVSSSPTFSCTFSSSPQRGLLSSNSRSGCSSVPKFRGCL